MKQKLRWSVIEDGNRVLIEFECRNSYEAIELSEVIASCMEEGHLELQFEEGSRSD